MHTPLARVLATSTGSAHSAPLQSSQQHGFHYCSRDHRRTGAKPRCKQFRRSRYCPPPADQSWTICTEGATLPASRGERREPAQKLPSHFRIR